MDEALAVGETRWWWSLKATMSSICTVYSMDCIVEWPPEVEGSRWRWVWDTGVVQDIAGHAASDKNRRSQPL